MLLTANAGVVQYRAHIQGGTARPSSVVAQDKEAEVRIPAALSCGASAGGNQRTSSGSKPLVIMKRGYTMKKVAVFMLSFACFATCGFAEWLEKNQQTIRLEYVVADDVGSETAHGAEVAFGKALYALDDVAIFATHLENSDMEAQRLGVSFQENFPISGWDVPLIPYAGVGIGYGWLDVDNGSADGSDKDRSGFLLRVEAGALVKLCDSFAISAGARFYY